jgi:hypothetical protein
MYCIINFENSGPISRKRSELRAIGRILWFRGDLQLRTGS